MVFTRLGSYQDKVFRNLKCKRVQCDEIWSFVYAKDKNLPEDLRNQPGVGSVWTWVALDPDTKLVPCWFVSSRDAGAAYHFMHDLAADAPIYAPDKRLFKEG
jgi:hypothetical protein